MESEQTRAQRMSLIEHNESEISVVQQAELLGLNRSSIYYKAVQRDPNVVAVRHEIDKIYTRSPAFGI